MAQAWADSLASIAYNQNDIAERGWTPSTYSCQLHPEILATGSKNGEVQESSNDNYDELDSPPNHKLNFFQVPRTIWETHGLYARAMASWRCKECWCELGGKQAEACADSSRRNQLQEEEVYYCTSSCICWTVCTGPQCLEEHSSIGNSRMIKVSEQQGRQLCAFKSLQNKVALI